MKNIEQKYCALLAEADRRGLPDIEGIRLCFRILSLAGAIDRDCARLLAPHGLSEGRFVLLFLLDQVPDGLAPHVLSEQAGVTRATITGLIDGMVRDGLVVRNPDPEDRRCFIIALTEKGKSVAKQVLDMHAGWISSLFCDITPRERALLVQVLDKVWAHTGKAVYDRV